MRFFVCFIFSIIFVCFSLEAQNSYIDKKIQLISNRLQTHLSDSLQLETICELALAYKNINAIKGLDIIKKEEKNSKYNDREKAKIFTVKADLISNIGNYNEAITLYSHTIAIYTKNNDQMGMANAYLGLSDIYSFQGQFTKALELVYKALKIAEKKSFTNILALSYHKTGNALHSIGENNTAIKNYLKAAKILETLNDSFHLADLKIDLGHAFYISGNRNQALKEFQIGVEGCQQSKNYRSLVKGYSYLGVYYNEQGETEKAIAYFVKAISTEIQDPYPYGIAFTYIHCANARLNLYKSTKNKAELIKVKNNLDKALDINLGLKNNLGLYLNYFALSEYYALKNDFKSSLEYYKKGVHFNDFIYNSATKETTKNIEDQRRIELKEKELKINQLELKANEKEKWLYLIVILFLVMIGGMLYYQNIQKKKTNNTLLKLNKDLDEANTIKLRFFSIINHDLRGPISSFISYFKLLKIDRDLLSPEEKNKMENSLVSNLENLLESMEDILIWSKGQMDLVQLESKQIFISDLFVKLQKHFSNHNGINIKYESEEELAFYTDENSLMTIMRNLTSNAIKACVNIQNPKIIWKAISLDNQTILSLTDNGIGASQEAFRALYDHNEVTGVKYGLGLHLIRDLADTIGCKIEVDSRPNEGTKFRLIFS